MTLTRTFLLSCTAAALLLVPLSSDTPAFFDDESSLQLQVTPRETEVFVDGYLAGRVDDFDGRFQRLHIQPGEHELTLYLDGHRKVIQTILIRPRSSFRIRYEMTPLAAGEAPDARPSKPAKPHAPPDAPAGANRRRRSVPRRRQSLELAGRSRMADAGRLGEGRHHNLTIITMSTGGFS